MPSTLSLRWFPHGNVIPLVRVVYDNQAGSATTMPAIVGPSSSVPHVKPQPTRAPAARATRPKTRCCRARREAGGRCREQLVYHYQRQRCVRTCAAIKGATSATYRVAAADLGASLALEVHVLNAEGVDAAWSSSTGPGYDRRTPNALGRHPLGGEAGTDSHPARGRRLPICAGHAQRGPAGDLMVDRRHP